MVSPLKSIKASIRLCLVGDYHSRAKRSEYIWFFLLNMLILFIGQKIGEVDIINNNMSISMVMLLCGYLVMLISVFIAAMMVSARRWHDIGLSGWFNLSCFVPGVNILVHLFLILKKGNEAANRYGEPLMVSGY